MPTLTLPWRKTRYNHEAIQKAITYALHPDQLQHEPEAYRKKLGDLAEAIKQGASWTSPYRPGVRSQGPQAPKPVSVTDIAQRAAAQLQPSAMITPENIELALRQQGLDWVEPFAPGRPLVPYYGYSRRPRGYDYRVGRNIMSDTRPDRIPFATLKQVIDGYDIASICIRHTINDLRSMPLLFKAMEGYEGDVTKDVVRARKFLARPDGKLPFNTWLAKADRGRLRYDALALHRERDRAGRLIALKVVDGKTIAPMTDYYGDIPSPPAPAYQQFIQGIPWDWLTTDDLIYAPHWPVEESLYGEPPIETVLLNANTDVRLQMFFLQFFTAGTVPELLLQAPPDMSDPDSLAEFQEMWDDWYEGNTSGRHGARYIPHGTQPYAYKNIQQMDPKIAEYVMRRTIAAYGRVPQDLGLMADVNKASSETQVDQQFRISTLPDTEFWESLLNSVLQEDLQLPVAVNFDDGREKEDRILEARVHEVYVNIGAESPDEVRSDVLGKDIDNDSRIPRAYYHPRLGPIPLGAIVAQAGKIDPRTLAPIDVDVSDQPFVPMYGMREDVSAGGMGQPAGPQIGNDPAKVGPGSGGKTPPNAKVTVKPGRVDVHLQQQGDLHTGKPQQAGRESNAANPRSVGRTGTAPERRNAVSRKSVDLARWQRQSRERVAAGKKPRHFTDSDIDPVVYDQVWQRLEKAASRDEVDDAFKPQLIAAGVAVQAEDTGRVLMLQREYFFDDEGHPDSASGRWEFPGGHLEEGETGEQAAVREWEEEMGDYLPPRGHFVGSTKSINGLYECFVYRIPKEQDVDITKHHSRLNAHGDYYAPVSWQDPEMLADRGFARPEVIANAPAVQSLLAKKAGGSNPKNPDAPVPGATSKPNS